MLLPNGFPVMEFVILGFHCFMLICFYCLAYCSFFSFLFVGKGWGWTNFFDTSVVVIVKAGLFEKQIFVALHKVFSIPFLFTCLCICLNSHVHLKNRSLLPFHKVFSIFIHTSTPLFQQLKCCIALVFARMHLLKNLMGRKFQKKFNLNEGWFVIRGSMVIVTVMCKVSNMVTVRYKVSVTVMYLVT